jgi:hypothetical protein
MERSTYEPGILGEIRHNYETGAMVVAIRDEELGPDAPVVELVVRRWFPDGRPDIETATVRAPKGGEWNLRLSIYADWLARVRASMTAGSEPAAGPAPRALTDDFLANVLRIYDAGPRGQKVEAVQATYGGSRGSVYRWLAEARERAEHS